VRRSIRLASIACVAIALVGCQSAQPEPTVVYDGAALYQGHCAVCHGEEGRGDGPFAALLVRSVPDLRAVQVRNELDLIEIIDGRGQRAAHGSQDMPVWGWAFREVERSENEVQARMQALARHVLSLQAR